MRQTSAGTRRQVASSRVSKGKSAAGQLLTDDIDALLLALHECGVFLRLERGRVHYWGPGQRIPRAIRAAIRARNREIARLINLSDPLVCPSPALHATSWGYQVRRACCDVCARLRPYVQGELPGIDTRA